MSSNKRWFKVEFHDVDSSSWAIETQELYTTYESFMDFVRQLETDPSLEILDYYEEEWEEEEAI